MIQNSSPFVTVPQKQQETIKSMNVPFTESEQATRPIIENLRLWWFNGLPTDQDTMAIGWHIQAGVHTPLDETLQSLGTQHYLIQHKAINGEGAEAKRYWSLRSCSLIFPIPRVQSLQELRGRERQGLTYAWAVVKNGQGKEILNAAGKPKRQTVLKAQVFVHELYQHGYKEPLPFTVAGYGTDFLLKSLSKQYEVLDYYSSLRRTQGRNAVAPFYLFSIPLGPGPRKLVGETQQGSLYPIMAEIPDTLTPDYLNHHLTPTDAIQEIRSGLLQKMVTWSNEETQRLLSPSVGVPPLPAPQRPHPPLLPQNEDLAPEEQPITPAQLHWIEQSYCGNSQEVIQQVCQYFGVSTLKDLPHLAFQALVDAKKQSQ